MSSRSKVATVAERKMMGFAKSSNHPYPLSSCRLATHIVRKTFRPTEFRWTVPYSPTTMPAGAGTFPNANSAQ
jgi:hypothetical protein